MSPTDASPPRWEQFVAGALLFLSTSAVIPVLRQGGEVNTTNEADPVMQMLWTIGYLVTVVLIVTRSPWRHVFEARRAWPIWLSVGLVIASAAWSPVPITTLQRGFAILGTTLLGLYLSTRFPSAQVWRMLAVVLAAVAIVSVLFSILLPEYGLQVDNRGTAWQGAFTTKGQLGRLMVIGSLLWLVAIRQSRRYFALKLLMLSVSVLLVVLSKSVTSLVVLIALVSFLPMFRIIRWHLSFVVPAVLTYAFASVVAVTWVWTNFGEVAALFGRDPTLTGRTVLWTEVWDKIQERPWFGYGYSGFWRGTDGPSGEIWIATGWEPPHAHNGYLDIWLQLGVLGSLLAIAMLVIGAAHAIGRARRMRGIDGEFPLLFLLFTLLTNISEVSILGRNSLYWVLFTTIYLQFVAGRDIALQPTRPTHRRPGRTDAAHARPTPAHAMDPSPYAS